MNRFLRDWSTWTWHTKWADWQSFVSQWISS